MDTDYQSVRATIRDEIWNDPALTGAIREFASNNAAYYPGYGNLGDALIQLGTLDLFNDLEWSPRIIEGRNPNVFIGHNHVVMGGGGGWTRGLWETYLDQVLAFLETGGQLLILPSTFSGFGSEFVPYAEQVTLFCREERSYEDLIRNGFPSNRIFVCHDLAFYVHPRHFSQFEIAGVYPDLKMLRRDEETTQSTVPRHSFDFPLLFNDIQWQTAAQCLAPLQAAATLISQFDRIETDRLHMSVLSALIGRNVKMSANSYFKNRAVFDYTLARFPNVMFSEPSTLRSREDMGRDAELRLLRDMFKKTRVQLEHEKESHQRTLKQNDKLLQRSEELPRVAAEKYRSREEALNREIILRDIELSAIRSSKINRLQRKYYALFDRPLIGRLFRKLRKLASA
ncbi:polysaccharide pyruvyl transferase family protein [Asaia sp. VD9]|uniref:polysaccharide pyruvyl transferase family protein n=1 Tax=Asaia sp. VD9 TaxID=3081235 RepID=UPI0030169DED